MRFTNGDAVFNSTGDDSTQRSARNLAADELVNIYQRLLSIAARSVRSTDSPEDLVQESIARCWPIVECLAMGPTRAVAYLGGAVRLIAREQWRRRRADESIDACMNVSDNLDDALQQLIREENATRLTRALTSLPSPQRAVVEECCIQGLTCEEVARLHGVSPASIRQRKHRACESLRRVLSDSVR